MLTIEINNLKFHGYHGFYSEEKILGNDFELSVHVFYRPHVVPVTSIHDTIDYTDLYDLIKSRMNTPFELLETLVSKMAHEIIEKFELAEKVIISIRKINPPIRSFEGNVGIKYELKRSVI